NPQNLVFQTHTDFDDGRIADRIEPEWPVDLAGDLLRQGMVKDRKERLGAGAGQRVWRQQVDLELQPFLGNSGNFTEIFLTWPGFNHVDNGGNVAGDGG